jgi:very-short-patch-repair endonuclease
MNSRSASPNDPLVRTYTKARVLAAGISEQRLRTLLRGGKLVRIGHDCYVLRKTVEALAGDPDRRYLLPAAAALASMGAGVVASHAMAARIHGIDLLQASDDLVTLTRAPGSGTRKSSKGIRLTAATLPASHITVRYGLRVTTPARTVVDLARALPFRAGVVTADSALRTKLTSKKELRAVVSMCRQWPGSARAREVVEFADRLSESALESIARVAFRELGLPPPTLQAQVGGDAPIGRADFLWELFNTIGEADGALKYADPDRARQQLRRDAKLRDAGFEVVHFGWWDITETPDRVGASILAAFERGRYAASPPLPRLRPISPRGRQQESRSGTRVGRRAG